MVQSVLGSLILGYRPLWNRARKLAGVQLYVHNESPAAGRRRPPAARWQSCGRPVLRRC